MAREVFRRALLPEVGCVEAAAFPPDIVEVDLESDVEAVFVAFGEMEGAALVVGIDGPGVEDLRVFLEETVGFGDEGLGEGDSGHGVVRWD
jgi:hypothetical protein